MRTLNEFVELVCTPVTGARYGEVAGRYGPSGRPRSQYIERTVAGQVRRAQLPNIGDDDIVAARVAAAVLEALDLKPSDFGY